MEARLGVAMPVNLTSPHPLHLHHASLSASITLHLSCTLSEFKLEYTKDLGESFASATSGFIQDDPAGNLTDLVLAVDRALQGIQKRGEKDHPLWGVQGVCLF